MLIGLEIFSFSNELKPWQRNATNFTYSDEEGRNTRKNKDKESGDGWIASRDLYSECVKLGR